MTYLTQEEQMILKGYDQCYPEMGCDDTLGVTWLPPYSYVVSMGVVGMCAVLTQGTFCPLDEGHRGPHLYLVNV